MAVENLFVALDSLPRESSFRAEALLRLRGVADTLVAMQNAENSLKLKLKMEDPFSFKNAVIALAQGFYTPDELSRRLSLQAESIPPFVSAEAIGNFCSSMNVRVVISSPHNASRYVCPVKNPDYTLNVVAAKDFVDVLYITILENSIVQPVQAIHEPKWVSFPKLGSGGFCVARELAGLCQRTKLPTDLREAIMSAVASLPAVLGPSELEDLAVKLCVELEIHTPLTCFSFPAPAASHRIVLTADAELQHCLGAVLECIGEGEELSPPKSGVSRYCVARALWDLYLRTTALRADPLFRKALAQLPAVVDRNALERFAEVTQARVDLTTIAGTYSIYPWLIPTRCFRLNINSDYTHCYSAEYHLGQLDPLPFAQLPARIALAGSVDERALRRERRDKAKKKLRETAKEKGVSMAALKNQKRLDNSLRQFKGSEENEARRDHFVSELGHLRNAGLKAENFQPPMYSTNFGANHFTTSEIAKALEPGIHIPCSTLEECTELLAGLMKDTVKHPKRFGDGTIVQKTKSNKIVNLSGMTAGHNIIVTSPTLASYKGAFVFDMDPVSGALVLLDTITPDRDPEDLGTRINVLASRLAISVPLVIGGTSTIVAQTSIEMSETMIAPTSLFAGKVASLSRHRHADIDVIGPQTHTLLHSTGLWPDASVRRSNHVDEPNLGLVRTSGVTNTTPVGTTMSYKPFELAAGQSAFFAGTAQRIASGWGNVLFSTTPVQIFQSSLTTVWKRHIPFGHLSGYFFIEMSTKTTGTVAGVWSIEVLVQFLDGSASSIASTAQAVPAINSNIQQITLPFDTRGPGTYNAGKAIDFIEVTAIEVGNTGNFTITSGAYDIIFHDIPEDTTYMSAMISGAVSQAQLNVQLTSHTEVVLDPAAEASKNLEITDDFPYDSDVFVPFLRALSMVGAPMSGHTTENFYAGAFWDFMKKAGKRLWKVGKPLLKQAVHEFVGATFTGSPIILSTHFAFPAISGSGEFGKVIPVCEGRGLHTPSFVETIGKPFCAADPDYTGESSDLAFLLAALYAQGWPVRTSSKHRGSKRLVASGQVAGVEYSNSACRFLLLPVDMSEEKAMLLQGDLVVATPVGFWNGQELNKKPLCSDLFVSNAAFDCNIREGPSFPGLPENSKTWEFVIVRK
jgi:hypothetical protein